MWLKETQKNDFQQNLNVNEKIFDKKSEFNTIEIYKSETFGNVLVLNDKPKMSNLDSANLSEMLVHIPLCSHPSAKKVLLIGANFGVLKEILKHKNVDTIDVIEQDKEIIEALKNFDNNADVLDNTKVNLIIDNATKIIRDCEDDKYDIILINSSIKNETIDKSAFFAHTKRVMNNFGILAMVSDSYIFDTDKLVENMRILGNDYKIVMPSRYEMYTTTGIISNIIVATNKYHPTADMILNKSDLLDDLKYYNSDLHKASFVMSTNVIKSLKEVAKN